MIVSKQFRTRSIGAQSHEVLDEHTTDHHYNTDRSKNVNLKSKLQSRCKSQVFDLINCSIIRPMEQFLQNIIILYL